VRQPQSQLALTAIAILLGLLVVIQLRAQQAGTGLETQSSQDLTLLIANLTTRNDQLRGEVSDLGRQLDAIAAANARGETSVGRLREDLERVRIWSGEAPAAGPGIRVLLFGGVPAEAISELVNELRNGGAEAIAEPEGDGETHGQAGGCIGREGSIRGRPAERRRRYGRGSPRTGASDRSAPGIETPSRGVTSTSTSS